MKPIRLSAAFFLSAVVAGLAAAVAMPAPAAAAEIPIVDFVRPAQFSNPRLSPDGKHLVVGQTFEKDGRDVRYIVIYDLTAMKVASTIGMPYFEVPVGYTWITNKRLVVDVGREFGSLEQPQWTGEILGMDLDGSNQEYLYGFQMYGRSRRGKTMANDEGFGTVAHVPQDYNGRFLLTENLRNEGAKYSRVYDIDATTAARRMVTEIDRPHFGFLMQHDGTPRFAYGYEESTSLAVFRFDDASKQWQQLPGSDRDRLIPWAILPGDKEVLASVYVDGGPSRLVRQSLADGSLTPLAQDKVGNIDRVEWGPRPWVPFAVATSVGIPKPIYIDDERFESKLHRILSAQFPGSYVRFINFADDGKLLFSVRSDRDPGAFYLFNRATNKANFLFAQRPWIEPEQMAERKPVAFKARDGREIHGYLTLPPGHPEGKLPMILLPHGGPRSRDEWFFDADAQFLASRGYAVLQVNFRGSVGRGPAFESAGYRQWGDAIQNDLIDGVRWVVGEGIADATRVCAYGGSFGAYSSMMVAIREPAMFKCAVGYAGLYDLAQLYDQNRTRNSKTLFNFWVKYIGQDPVELARNSPARLADKLTVPVLLVHGSRDEVTEPRQAETMRDALAKAGRPPEWMFVADEGHGFYAVKNRQAFYEKLERFLAKHLAK